MAFHATTNHVTLCSLIALTAREIVVSFAGNEGNIQGSCGKKYESIGSNS